jgi:hypothetical protein
MQELPQAMPDPRPTAPVSDSAAAAAAAAMPSLDEAPPLLDLQYAAVSLAPGKGGLIGIGVLFFAIGALGGCFVASMLAMLTGRLGPAGSVPGSFLGVLLMYAAVTAGSIWMGVACCRARRWVRPLILSLA